MSKPERALETGTELVQFGVTFVKSAAFKAIFSEGMSLVEEAANYLDGDGRADAASLDRRAAMTYASESMRLTTRLMQIASWLLVQRAVAEGEITTLQAQREKDRVKLGPQEQISGDAEFAELPERLRDLVALTLRLHARVTHLDRLIAGTDKPAAASPAHAVAAQQGLIAQAFGKRSPADTRARDSVGNALRRFERVFEPI
jgi:regulator of CtrA degradation